MRLCIKNWTSFQHYKKRRPPWVKLHRTLLDDVDFLRCNVYGRALAPMLWLLASESNDGTIDGDIETISYRLRLPADEVRRGLNALEAIGYATRYHNDSVPLADDDGDASNVLATCKQHDTLEVETETETERETEAESDRVREAEKALIERALPILGIGCEMHIHNFLTTHPSAWVEQALMRVAERNPTVPMAYMRRVLEEWAKRGGPDDGAGAGSGDGGKPKHRREGHGGNGRSAQDQELIERYAALDG